MWFGTRQRVCVFISDIIKYVELQMLCGLPNSNAACKERTKKERKKERLIIGDEEDRQEEDRNPLMKH